MFVDLSGDVPDAVAPSVAITQPSDKEVVSGNVQISLDTADLNGVSAQEIYIDGSLVSVSSSYSWDTTSYTDGIHTIRADATDPSGNTRSDWMEVTVDNNEFVVINEFLPDPYSLYSEEWIELYNPTGAGIDLSGYILDDIIGGGTSPYTFPQGSSISAYGY